MLFLLSSDPRGNLHLPLLVYVLPVVVVAGVFAVAVVAVIIAVVAFAVAVAAAINVGK